ncbi:transcriptional regulator [Sulfodiicoccus acidiphilus]|uniref:Transcriptional regulator n=1 Tax=Sulfodiicoccus acidiphilus TaxID=1670455 RepID=A0A348B1A5_9CREN|nr:winged helix-turn-helix domain-containing protein [Sulfodiicoccus acidiphilus]BBD71957.1 transcriptional regulator [Sulfodiicoccus acidiphilus]GGT91752.1 transcriptional regulator [Sulfodiicoccus acidiphilus]
MAGRESKEDREFRKLFKYLFYTSRGGQTRLVILRSLLKEGKNANKIAMELGLDYKTVTHHLEVLMDNHIIWKEGEGYASPYRISNLILPKLHLLDELERELSAKKDKRSFS